MRKPGIRIYISVGALGGALLTLAMFVSCGGPGVQPQTVINPTTGSATTSIGDPPTCKAPMGDFQSVWVTITRVRAHISSDASSEASGWVDLIDLRNDPKQIDLLSLQSTTCVLTQLGSTSGLPVGNYQQIRLHLLSNTPGASDKTPATNHCGSNAFNCVQLADGTIKPLLLSSEDTTGIKIPPGRIAGGAISITAGQSADINIDFSACASLIQQGNGDFRLMPTLHAGEVSLNKNSISGGVVDSVSKNPIANAIVQLEQPDSNAIDRVIIATVTDSNGSFIFCPLPSGNYDVVAAAQTTVGLTTTTYNATITFNVPVGSNTGNIPLVAESAALPSPGTITGQVTTTTSSAGPTAADIAVSALQDATPTGGALVHVTIPTFPGSTANVSTAAGGSCPLNTDCADYTLVVPASNPSVGTFSSAGTGYLLPVSGGVSYTVNGLASITDSTGNHSDCSPSSVTTNSLMVTAGISTTASPLAFTGCQ